MTNLTKIKKELGLSRTELRDVETIIKSFDELRKMESEYMQKREAVLEKIKQTDLYLFNGVTYCRLLELLAE